MTIKNQLVKIFNIMFVVIFYYILILAIGKMNLQSPVSAMFFIPFFYLLFRIFKHGCKEWSNPALIWWCMQGISFIIMIIMVYQLRVSITWDWGQLLRTAYHYTMTGELDNSFYYMRYPNNQFWLVCLIGICRLISIGTSSSNFATYKGATMIVSIFMLQGTFWLIYRTAKFIWSEKRALLVGIVVLCYVPFYQYAMFLYTDVPGVCITVLLIYCAVMVEKCDKCWKKIVYSGVFGILAACACYIKLTVSIVFVAIIIVYLLKYKVKMVICYGSIIAIFLFLSSAMIENLIDSTLQFDRDEAIQYEFPPTHWIMMMLNTSGGYYQEDVDYTRSYITYEEKETANIAKIKERIADRGASGTIKHILYTKQIRTWTNSCIAGDDYVGRKPINERSFCQKIFSQNGKWHGLCLVYTWLVHITILIGLLLSAVLSCKRTIEEQKLLVGRIAVFGLFLFLSIWECNSRYLFVMVPVMIFTAADGIFTAYDRYYGAVKMESLEFAVKK